MVLRFNGFSAHYIREKRWHPSQQLKELKDGIELQLHLPSRAEVQRWVLSWSGQVKAIAPPELIVAVNAAADQLTRDHRI